MTLARAAAPLLLACLLLPPRVGADGFGGSAPLGLDGPHVPQAYCVVVQNRPAPATAPERCTVTDVAVRGAHVLRVRIWGEGHVFTWTDQHLGNKSFKQFGPLECSSDLTAPSWSDLVRLDPDVPASKTCVLLLSGTASGISGTFNLHVFVDGPGRAVVAVDLERVAFSLP